MATAQPGSVGAPASHPYTCNTCQVAYRNIDLQKGHMKSDWQCVSPTFFPAFSSLHFSFFACSLFPAVVKDSIPHMPSADHNISRYNLKRRVASLPPIASDIFTEKVLRARAASTVEANKAYFERICDACQRTYYSENAYHNHLSSQKHKLNESTYSQHRDDETRSLMSSTFSLGNPVKSSQEHVDSEAEDEFNQVVEGLQKANVGQQQRPSPVKRPSNPQPSSDLTGDDEGATGRDLCDEASSAAPVNGPTGTKWTTRSCIFCNYEFAATNLNVTHMERFHGMFIPEKPFLVDLDGLVQLLQDKVRNGNQCLYCSKIKTTTFGVQTHMRDKGHCKIPYTTEQEQLQIGDFYDFRSTYSDKDGSESDLTEDEASGAKPGARRPVRVTDSDGDEVDDHDSDDNGWETDSSTSFLGEGDLQNMGPSERAQTRLRRSCNDTHHPADDQTDSAFYDDYELHLPSGKSVGHRSLNKYYRQNLAPYPTAEERAERLAIEAADGDRGGKDDGGERISTNGGRGRVILPRGNAGLVGAPLQKQRAARRSEQRGRKLEDYHGKKKDLAYGTKLNNYKGYYYRYQGGG